MIDFKGKKILFCGNLVWDMVNFRGYVMRQLVRAGCDVVLVAHEEAKDSKKLNYIPKGVRYIPVRMDRCGTNPLRDMQYMLRLLRIYRAEWPDYIFHYTIKPNIYGTFAASCLRIPSAAMVAGLGYAFTEGGFVQSLAAWLYKVAARRADCVFALSKDNYDFLLSHGIGKRDKIVWLTGGEGVDLKAYPYKNNEAATTTFLFVARVLIDKGYHEFVAAAKMVKERFPKARFRVLGSVDPSYPLHVPFETIRADVESGAISYLGVTDNVQGVEGRAGTVVVLPSYHEGMSRSLMEAISMGRPVICSDIPGCRETVREGENGYLAKPRDAASLAEAMMKYLELSTEEKDGFSRASRRLAEEVFDIDHVVGAYKKVLRKALGS